MLRPTRVDGTCSAVLVSLPNKEKPPACDMAGILSLGYFSLSVPPSKAEFAHLGGCQEDSFIHFKVEVCHPASLSVGHGAGVEEESGVLVWLGGQ